jgi:TldD protein
MRDLVEAALDAASGRGVTYADVRVETRDCEEITVRNGAIGSIDRSDTAGIGVRVLRNGAWGFAGATTLSPAAARAAGRRALDVARASARVKGGRVTLAAADPVDTVWVTPHAMDPFAVALEGKLDLLFAIDAILRKKKAVVVAESSMEFTKRRQWLGTSEGTRIDQTLLVSGAGYSATAAGGGDSQVRSYPASHGGQGMTGGYEVVLGLDLAASAARIRDEAVALLKAPPCPSGTMDLVLGGSQLALQIHESCGHPSELDRVLGMEANFAGTSFLTREKKGRFRYGSDLVTLMADTTVPGGLGTCGFDDEGVPAGRWPIVDHGIFRGYMTNRQYARFAGERRSRGCARAEGPLAVPMIRITNLSLLPVEGTFEDLVADTGRGIFMDVNKSWSIDQQRLNFQFGTEVAWEIRKGRLGRMFRNPTYQGITPAFWKSCDAVCGPGDWKLWGVSNCGKGQPVQTAAMSHGAAPARFRGVTVGVGS